MIRGAVGSYTSVMDYDEWRFGSLESRSSLLKFSPQFIIAPGRMVRMMAMGTKPADLRIDLAMGVPLEFLTSEMWFCTSIGRSEESSNPIKHDNDGEALPRIWGMPCSFCSKLRSGEP